MRTISATDVAIASALKAGTLRARVFATRFGDHWVSIEDSAGVIEVDEPEAAAVRVKLIREALA